jgi:hypothetical protein
MFRQLIVGLFAAGFVGMAVVSGCNRASAQGGFQMPPPQVTTATVVFQDVPSYLDEIGRTTATEAVNIVPQVAQQGRVAAGLRQREEHRRCRPGECEGGAGADRNGEVESG